MYPRIITSIMTRHLRLMESRRKGSGGTVRHQYTITIPRVIVDAFGWDKDTQLAVRIKGKGVLEVREADDD